MGYRLIDAMSDKEIAEIEKQAKRHLENIEKL
jgi:hypothetical protein